ncbi:hypothetical protein [uncultured Pontibacter sp.]|uniref:hypothetical protein n=1 Tax=uncultured Pontibacter sp. TaxID=453356 RepID=UPI00261514FE|nr:hypothetical protein [uncultured Pontibacter sp.]
MNVEQVVDQTMPGNGELEAEKVVSVIVKLTKTHDAFVNMYPELTLLVDAVVGEITVIEPDVEDLLMLRLLNIIHHLNINAEKSEVYKELRKNFQSDLYHHINNNLPEYKGEFYL